MENYTYYSFHTVSCILIEKKDRIRLIPCNENDFNLLFEHTQDKDFEINYSEIFYNFNHAFIHSLVYGDNYIDLFPDYIFHSISPKICAMEIRGPAVDDFFSPSTYFFYKSKKEGTNNIGNVVYNSDIADCWVFHYTEKNERIIDIKISLYYGSILNRGIASDLMLHPILKIEFEETESFSMIYDIYQAIKRFFNFILYRNDCGKFDIELFGRIEDRFSSVGCLTDNQLTNAKYEKQIGRIYYSDYKDFIPSIFQFIFNNPSLYLKHLPQHGTRDWEKDDIELLLTQLFSAFESECHKSEKLYEHTDSSIIKNIKEKLINSIDKVETDATVYTNDEIKFISDAKQRINQLGTQFGQKAKIINAYKVLSASLEELIPDILFRKKEYQSTSKVSDEQINDIAKQLTHLRGAIVHGGEHKSLSPLDCQTIRFFEVLIYAQMLYRAELSLSDIKMILSSSLLHHNDLFNRSWEKLEEKKEQSSRIKLLP